MINYLDALDVEEGALEPLPLSELSEVELEDLRRQSLDGSPIPYSIADIDDELRTIHEGVDILRIP